MLAAAAALFWVLTEPRAAAAAAAPALQAAGDAGRGRRVFVAADCASCHASPGQTNRLRLGGGLALTSPYGNLYVPNISQHPQDGIGRWSTADLANAVLEGVSPARQHYYPTFPYPAYAHMRPADVADLMAYLRTLPPVAGRAPPHDLPFPFSVRRFTGIWKLLYFDRRTLADDPAQPPQWNRGRYLVRAMAHCDECHSSRDLLGGIRSRTRFAGGADPSGTGWAPNITPAAIGGWSADDIARLLDDGRTPDLRRVGSSMASVVENTHALDAADRQAIAAYVKTLRSRPTPPP